MKKVLALFLGLTLITACSDDNDSNDPQQPDPTNSFRLSQIVNEFEGGFTTTTTFTYDSQNRLVSITDDDGFESNFIYTNNLLTGYEEYVDNFLEYSSTFEYDAQNRLIAEDYDIEGDTGTISFTYGQNGTITVTDTDGSSDYVLTYDGSNFVSEEYIGGSGNEYMYTLDDKNTPFKNIGFGAGFLVNTSFLESHIAGNTNNVLSYTNVGGTDDNDYTATYTYNADDYPLTEVRTFSPGTIFEETVSTTYSYE